MVKKKSDNLEKSQKFIFSSSKMFLFLFFFAAKKCYPLSFPILGGCNLTRALQSSPFLKYENFENYQKLFFLTKIKKRNAFLLFLQIQEISIPTELSSPAHFRIQGGSPERDIHRRSSSSRTVLLLSNKGLLDVEGMRLLRVNKIIHRSHII